jgi:hypothetical protein
MVMAASVCVATTPVASATNILTLATPAGPVAPGEPVEVTAALRWNGPLGLYQCEGALTGKLSTNKGRADTVTLTQGALPGLNAGEGCLTGYIGEVQVTPGNLPWSLTLERKGKAKLAGEKEMVVDWRLLSYREQCVFSRKGAINGTYTTAKPVELIWPATTFKASKTAHSSLCDKEGKYSGELYLSSRGEQIEAVEEALP